MSGYEVEHGVNLSQTQKKPTRRPDLSTFYSITNETYGDTPEITNPHAEPTPENVTASFRLLADAFELILTEHGNDNEPLRQMIAELEASAGNPPTKREGVPDSFLAELVRVPKSRLKKADKCPICSEPFLDDEYPLVVKLPCDDRHLFDLECIRPWLKLNPTCPLDRKTLVKKKEPPPKDDEEEDYDDYYA